MCQQYFQSLASHRIIAKTSFLFNKSTMQKQSKRYVKDNDACLILNVPLERPCFYGVWKPPSPTLNFIVPPRCFVFPLHHQNFTPVYMHTLSVHLHLAGWLYSGPALLTFLLSLECY